MTKKRMETIDDDIAARAVDYIKRQAQAGKPFFLWVNFTHMHFRTHPKPESIGQSGRWQSEYHDVMIDHDKNVGQVLKALDDAGIADNTFVMYGTDNGPHMNSWPDGAMTPFRSEKNTNWEGAYRVPCVVRWPGQDQAGHRVERNGRPSRLAADVSRDGRRYRGQGQAVKGPHDRRHDLQGPPRRLQSGAVPNRPGGEEPARVVPLLQRRSAACRLALRQLEAGVLGAAVARHPELWAEPFTTLRVPKIFNLRTDPFERADITSNTYYDWLISHVYMLVPAQAFVGEFLQTFREFPQRQKAASFNLDEVLRKMQESTHS